MKKVFYVIVAIALCLFVGWVSSLLNVESISSWYPTLNRSSLTPPAVAFPIVWSVLCVLIGISAGLLYGAHDLSKKLLLWLFVLQLFFNVSWNFLFFYLQSPIMGFVNLLVLDVDRKSVV